MDPLGALIDWLAVYGVIGLMAIGAAERFIPILPSYGVLAAIGIAAANNVWSIEAAIAATVLGGLIGCFLWYALALALSEERTRRLLTGICRVVGVSASQVDRTMTSFRIHQRSLSFGLQLVPAIRLVAPVIAGLFRADAKAFLLASLAGIFVWNGLFIAVGHIAANVAPATSASALAVRVLIVLLVVEFSIALLWRQYRRAAPARSADPQDPL